MTASKRRKIHYQQLQDDHTACRITDAEFIERVRVLLHEAMSDVRDPYCAEADLPE